MARSVRMAKQADATRTGWQGVTSLPCFGVMFACAERTNHSVPQMPFGFCQELHNGSNTAKGGASES